MDVRLYTTIGWQKRYRHYFTIRRSNRYVEKTPPGLPRLPDYFAASS